MDMGFLPINKSEIDKCRQNLFFNEYYDVEKLNYMIYKDDDKYDKNCEFAYLEYINETEYDSQLESGVEYYKSYRRDIPFIDDIALFIVRNELNNPISKREIKKMRKKVEKDKLEQEKLQKKKIREFDELKRKQIKIENRKVVVKFN